MGTGQRGNDHTTPYPIDLPAGRTAVAVSTGWKNSCVILDDGTGMCWGLNTVGQIGDGTTTNRDEPTPITILPTSSTLAAIAIGGGGGTGATNGSESGTTGLLVRAGSSQLQSNRQRPGVSKRCFNSF